MMLIATVSWILLVRFGWLVGSLHLLGQSVIGRVGWDGTGGARMWFVWRCLFLIECYS